MKAGGTYFYRMSNPDNDAYLSSQFPDLSDGGSDYLYVSGGNKNNRISILEMQIPFAPTYGQAELSGLRAFVYLNDVTSLEGVSKDKAIVKAYRTREKTDFTQGGTAIGNTDIGVFTSTAADSCVSFYEDFTSGNYHLRGGETITQTHTQKLKIEGYFVTVADAVANQRDDVGGWAKLNENEMWFRYSLAQRMEIDPSLFGAKTDTMARFTTWLKTAGQSETYFEGVQNLPEAQYLGITDTGKASALIEVEPYTHWAHNTASAVAEGMKWLANDAWGISTVLKDLEGEPPAPEKLWRPISGQSIFPDIYLKDGDHIRPVKTTLTNDVTTSTPNLKLPTKESKVKKDNSQMYDIRRSGAVYSRNSNNEDYAIGYADFVFTEDVKTGATAGSLMCEYNVPLDTSNSSVNNVSVRNDPTPASRYQVKYKSGSALASDSTINYLQEVRGTTGPFPAPVVQASNTVKHGGDIWHKPKIELEVKMNPDFYYSEDSTAEGSGKKITLRRCVAFFFHRYRIKSNKHLFTYMTENVYNKRKIRGLAFFRDSSGKINVYNLEDCYWYSGTSEPYFDYRDAIGYIDESDASDWFKIQINCDMNLGMYCDIMNGTTPIFKNIAGDLAANIRLASRYEDTLAEAQTGAKSVTKGDFRTHENNYWSEARVHSTPEEFTGTSAATKPGLEAGLEYCWLPYLSFVSLNTRMNGDLAEGAVEENASNASSGVVVGSKIRLNTNTSFQIDSIKASRFFLAVNNASQNAPVRDNLKIFGAQKLPSPKTHMSIYNNTDQDTDNVFSEGQFNIEGGATNLGTGYYMNDNNPQNLLHLGFKTRSDIESASGKHLLFNAFTRTYGSVDSSITTYMAYSADSEYLGEVPSLCNTNNATLESAAKNVLYTSSNAFQTDATNASSKTVTVPSFRNYWYARDKVTSSGSFHHLGYGLDGAASEFVLSGTNYVEQFSQKGLVKIAFDTTANTNLFSTSPNSEASETLHGMTMYKYTWTGAPFEGSGQDTSFGLEEVDRSGVYDYKQRRLNWQIYKSDGTNNIAIGCKDAAGAIYLTKDIGSTSDTFYITPGQIQKRENPFIQANVLSATKNSDSSFTVQLDHVGCLTGAYDDEYLLYFKAREWVPEIEDYGAGASTALHTEAAESDDNSWVRQAKNVKYRGVNAPNERTHAVICHVQSLGNEIVRITQPTNSAISAAAGNRLEDMFATIDANYDGHASTDVGTFQNAGLAISPYRYWVHIRHGIDDDIERDYLSICTVTGDNLETDPTTAASDFHSTFAESQFTDAAVNSNPWSWDYVPENSQLELSKDYGYGSFSAQDKVGGHICISQVATGKFNRIKLDNMVRTDNLKTGEQFSIVLAPDDIGNTDVMQFYSENKSGTTYDPYLETEYFDPKPRPPTDFKVMPQEDRPFYPRYTWSVEDEDLWYGFLIVDNKPIESQYHGSILHLPLNQEENVDNRYWRPDQNQYIWSHAGTAVNTDASTYSHVGFTGDGRTFGPSNYITINDGSYTDPTTQFSVIAHIIPTAAPTGDGYILHKSKEFTISYTSSYQIKTEIFPSGDTNTDAVPVTLTSTSVINPDGESPCTILLTLDTEIKNANVKLFINGKLEDQSGLRKSLRSLDNWNTDSTYQTHTGALNVGRSTSSHAFNGHIEEVVLYNRLIYPVVPSVGEFDLVKPLRELNSAQEAVSVTYVGRVFTKDYHNIRGGNHDIGGVSPQAAFRKSAFKLTTN